MHVPLLIERKRDGKELVDEEIHFLIEGFTSGSIPESQMSALAMAIYFQGMSDSETGILTAAMRDSGRSFRWPADSPPKVDKHSTGGVGDKVSLILAPLLACDDLWVPMVSGRGLGITGGTLDKLESIPGFNVFLSEEDSMAQIKKIGVFLVGQTADLCPADKKLYSLRDVTGTVPSIPLIVASIMSKKLAESLDRLVLDVKFGKGAFMKNRGDAVALAEKLQSAGRDNGVATSYLLSPMDEPIGAAVGNALEVLEVVETLQGGGPQDLRELVLNLASQVSQSSTETLAGYLDNGKAWEKFVTLVLAQGGDARILEHPEKFHPAAVIEPMPAPQSGTLRAFDAGMVGETVVRLGGGRKVAADQIDFSVGLSKIKKTGSPVEKEEPLCLIHAANRDDADMGRAVLSHAVVIE